MAKEMEAGDGRGRGSSGNECRRDSVCCSDDSGVGTEVCERLSDRESRFLLLLWLAAAVVVAVVVSSVLGSIM